MQAQGQAPRSKARVKVGPFHLDSLGGWSPTQDAVGGAPEAHFRGPSDLWDKHREARPSLLCP